MAEVFFFTWSYYGSFIRGTTVTSFETSHHRHVGGIECCNSACDALYLRLLANCRMCNITSVEIHGLRINSFSDFRILTPSAVDIYNSVIYVQSIGVDNRTFRRRGRFLCVWSRNLELSAVRCAHHRLVFRRSLKAHYFAKLLTLSLRKCCFIYRFITFDPSPDVVMHVVVICKTGTINFCNDNNNEVTSAWRRGFMFSSMRAQHLVYCGWCSRAGFF